MIAVQFEGGLGNQLFQYAFGRSLATRLNTELKIDISWNEVRKDSHHCGYKLYAFNIEENFATEEELKNLTCVKEYKSSFIPEVFSCRDNTFFLGLWQCGKYFEKITDTIRQEFSLKNELEKNSALWRDKILTTDCAVSVHVRRGDYLMPSFRNHSGIVPVKYYHDCINELKKIFSDLTIFVFSDDIDWAKNNLQFDVSTNFVEGCEHDFEELYLMSLCKHNVVSNGTFAWWGAWLNQNPDKKVFAPYPWARSGWGGDTIIPENWIKIPVDYTKNKTFAPLLSIIVNIENNSPLLQFSLSSIFSQNKDDYEVIFIDSSNDGTGEFCRQLVSRDNICFLKKGIFDNKFSALNKALDCATGDYILILDTKSFLANVTVGLLADILEGEYRAKYNYGDKKYYLKYEDYVENKSPSIICGTEKFIEDINGITDIHGLQNKKFSIQIDEPFKNLNAIAEFKIDSAQKLMMIATQQINNSLATKFFKRKFLMENKIRFKNNPGGGRWYIAVSGRKFHEY